MKALEWIFLDKDINNYIAFILVFHLLTICISIINLVWRNIIKSLWLREYDCINPAIFEALRLKIEKISVIVPVYMSETYLENV